MNKSNITYRASWRIWPEDIQQPAKYYNYCFVSPWDIVAREMNLQNLFSNFTYVGGFSFI